MLPAPRGSTGSPRAGWMAHHERDEWLTTSRVVTVTTSGMGVGAGEQGGQTMNGSTHSKHLLLVSDFDQTLSFNDSGLVLSQLLGASGFEEKVAGLARTNLVHQGAELAYLIRHDPDFRGVRRDHLVEVGRHVRLRSDIPVMMEFLERGLEGYRFSFFVVSAAPKEVIQSALSG